MSEQNTPPAVSDAMREAVAREICSVWEYLWDGNPDEDDQVSPETTDGYDDRPSKTLFLRAADAILAGPIASEIARLTGERDAAHAAVARLTQGRDNPPVTNGQKVSFSEFLHANARAEAAEAETARLRAALEEAERVLIGIAKDVGSCGWLNEDDRSPLPEIRAALSSQEKTDA